MGLDEGGDIGLEPIDAALHAALDLLVGEQREPAFDLVEPGGAGRGEVEVIARVALCQEGARAPCCTRDEGRPFGAVL